MFLPKYVISDQLLANIKRINSLVLNLNSRRFPKLVLAEFEKTARAISAHASTSIEGNPLPLTEVKKILKSKPENIRNSEREVLNYNQALIRLNTRIKSNDATLTLELILDIHRQVIDGLLPPYESGRLREKPVVVNDPRIGQVVYLPPDVEKIEELMKDLVFFVTKNNGHIDPLIIAGIFHKQMVIIHPFMDGNGRTTRIATKVLLAQMGLDTFNLFSFENYYNQNVMKYFQMVGEYGDYNELSKQIDFTKWLEYFTEGIIDELLRLTKRLPEASKTPETRLDAYHQRILDYIHKHNFITNRDYARLTNRAKATRNMDFQKLIDLEYIERKGKGRSTYYVLKAP